MQTSPSAVLEGLVGKLTHALFKTMGEFGDAPRQCDILRNICLV